MSMSFKTSVFGFIALLLLVIIIAPLATIWALNTLFPVLAIPLSWETWLAALVLFGTLANRK